MAPVSLNQVFLPALIFALLRSKTTPVLETPAEDQYDFIVVGSGWGGSVVANRLSEDPSTSVLLLEAGAKDNVSSEIPLLSLALHRRGYDWGFKSPPQKHACWSMKEKRCLIASGKVEGGSSILDILIYSRPQKNEIDRWGLPEWTGDEINKYITKSQDFHGNLAEECDPANEKHGCGGPVYVGSIPPGGRGKRTDLFIESAKDAFGLKQHENIVNEIGVNDNMFLIRKGVRVGASSAYLKPISRKRQNLHISLNSFVLKILIDPSTKRATGVLFEKDGVVKEVKARKEVIVSAGTFGSPKLLMLSGIGPKEELEKFDIPVIGDIPGVGKNFKDMLSSLVFFQTDRFIDVKSTRMIEAVTIGNWSKGIGMMTSPSGFDAIASLRTPMAPYDKDPDMWAMLQSLSMYELFADFIRVAFGFTDEFWAEYFGPLVNRIAVNIQPSIIAHGNGTVTLSSSNPKDDPIIDPNFYGDERDLQRMIEAVRLTMKFAEAKPFKDFGFTYMPSINECNQYTNITSDEYITCTLKYLTLPRYLYIGTCKMGLDDDKMAVVDQRLRVRGISGLRVVDASVLPAHVSAPISATVMAVAEKAADLIKEDYK